jgi:TM2 domain-containing membrane protein YozV
VLSPSSGKIILFSFLVQLSWPAAATLQNPSDTIPLPDSIVSKKHNPTKATLFSAVLPGLGQIYNKKYCKVPVIYAGFGVMTYFIYTNTDEYLDFRCAYIESVNGITNGNYAYLVNRYSEQELLSAIEYYRRNLEISVLITALWYVLNIIDATVDAHLFTYNISQNLALRVAPGLVTPADRLQIQPGVKLCLKF